MNWRNYQIRKISSFQRLRNNPRKNIAFRDPLFISLNNRRARFLIFVPENHPLSLSPNHQWKKRSIRIYPLCAKASSVPFFSFESSPYRCQEDKLSRWKGCQGLVCITGKIHRNGIPSSFKAGFFLPLTISLRENVVVYERSARMREIRTSQRLSVK